jgi:DNA-damage-inducible protein D
LYSLLGYTQWRNFETIINKAKAACTNAGEDVAYHFADVSKMVSVGSGVEREIDDIYLTRYACYLTAQNGDARKPAIAFAQNYCSDKACRIGGTTSVGL